MSNEFSLNIPFLLSITKKWKWKIIIFLVVLLIVSSIIVFLLPNRYYSYVTAISTNSQLNDKSAVYNNNIDELHNSLGSWNDLERLYSTCDLDTSYKYLIYKYNLASHYKVNIEDENKKIQKTLQILKEENMNIEKMETGLLRIHVWDEDPQMAANLANSFIENIEISNRSLQKEYNENILKKINEDIEEKSTSFKKIADSNYTSLTTADEQLVLIKKNALIDEISQLEKIANQYQLMLKAQQPSLLILDKAISNKKHVSPKRLSILTSVLISGFVFSIFLILLLESIAYYQHSNEGI